MQIHTRLVTIENQQLRAPPDPQELEQLLSHEIAPGIRELIQAFRRVPPPLGQCRLHRGGRC